MFKSIYAKYVFAFMVIISLSFAVIIGIITSIIGNYSKDAKKELMSSAAMSAEAYLTAQMKISGSEELSELYKHYPEEVSAILTSLSYAKEDVTLILTDNEGNILSAYGANAENALLSKVVPESFIERSHKEGELFLIPNEDNIFDESHIVLTSSVKNGEENTVGVVYACSSTATLSSLLSDIVKLVIIAILWVMLAVLIAVYVVSERVISPLRQISRAAKSFAKGDFDVRVEVKGHDEIAELAVAFNNMAESLDNYEKMRNTFISNVSHDLRSPMTSISGFVDGILDGVIPPEKHEHYLKIISAEVKRLSRLVATLLDLSKIQAGERKFTMAPFDICEMARQILFSFEKKIDEKKLNIEFELDEDNITAIADRDAIYQILYNICDNAVKFSNEGGLLRVSVKKHKGRRYLVGVYNEGEGISPADLPHVFERFYKSDKSRGLDKTGVGLGLFISKTIIEAHDEDIFVESEYGKNCFFGFTIKGQ